MKKETAADKATHFAGLDTEECIEWPLSRNRFGYGILTTHGKFWLANRFVCRIAHGEPTNPLMEAAHSCRNPGCVNPRHLEWKTHKQNNSDKIAHGTSRYVWGESHGRAKLTEPSVTDIILKLHQSVTPMQLASEYGVNVGTIYQIRKGKTWAWIERPSN